MLQRPLRSYKYNWLSGPEKHTCEVKGMISKINYYISIPEGDFERFSEELNKAVIACLTSIKELGDAFGRAAAVLRNDKFYDSMCKAN